MMFEDMQEINSKRNVFSSLSSGAGPSTTSGGLCDKKRFAGLVQHDFDCWSNANVSGLSVRRQKHLKRNKKLTQSSAGN